MIYVTVPVHNEQHTIGVLLWRVRSVFAELNRDFRILVLDDASTDDTLDVLEPYRRVLPLMVLENERRQGYAASLERLLREAVRVSRYLRRDGVLVMQADFTDDPEWIPEMLRRFQGGADLVATRPTDIRDAPRAVLWARRGAGLLARAAGLPEGIDDPFCGFRLYRLIAIRRALDDLGPDGARLLRHDGWAANMELLAAVAPHLRRHAQVDIPVDYSRRYRESRFRPFAELWELLRATRDPRLRRNGETAAPAAG